MINPQLLQMLMQRGQPQGGSQSMVPRVDPATLAMPNNAGGRALHGQQSTMDKLAQMFTGQQMGANNANMVGDAGRQGLMQAGLALLAAPKTKGTFGQNLAGAIQTGMGAARGAYQEAEFDQALSGYAPETRALIKAFGPGAIPQGREGFTLGKNEVHYDADGRPVAANIVPDKPDVPSYDSAIEAGLLWHGFPANAQQGDLPPEVWRDVVDYAQEYRKSAALQNITNVGGNKDTQDMRVWDKSFDRVTDVQERGIQATGQLTQVNRALDLVLDPEVDQGAFGPLLGSYKSLASAFGIDITGLDKTQALVQIIGQFKLTAAESLKGALSDNDLKFLEQTIISLQNEPGGNERILQYMKFALGRARDAANDTRRWEGEGLDYREIDRRLWEKYEKDDVLYKFTPVDTSAVAGGSGFDAGMVPVNDSIG